MRILVAGATGAVGRPLVSQLLAAGHSVVGLTRSATKAATVRALGAEAAVADALDAKALRDAVVAASPDAIAHEMTDLSGASDLRDFDRSFAGSNRLRTLGTDNLLAAAREAGVDRLVAQSYCGWPYARVGGAIKSETDPLDPDPPKQLHRSLEAIRHLEGVVTGSSRPAGIVLRYGSFYGRDTGLFEGSFADQIRRRRVPLIGDGDGWWSFVQVDDAARATVLALQHGRPGEIYNIVDDEPAPVRQWLPALAELLGARPPRRIPAWLARLLGSEHLVAMMTAARAGSNAKAGRELAWRPEPASWRQGFADIVGRRRAA